MNNEYIVKVFSMTKWMGYLQDDLRVTYQKITAYRFTTQASAVAWVKKALQRNNAYRFSVLKVPARR